MALSSYEVLWSDEAIRNKNSIERYLTETWTTKELQQFFRILDERITLISQQPEAFPLSKKGRGYRRSVLTSQITIYYKFEDDIVQIRSVFDTRQNPDKLNLTE